MYSYFVVLPRIAMYYFRTRFIKNNKDKILTFKIQVSFVITILCRTYSSKVAAVFKSLTSLHHDQYSSYFHFHCKLWSSLF